MTSCGLLCHRVVEPIESLLRGSEVVAAQMEVACTGIRESVALLWQNDDSARMEDEWRRWRYPFCRVSGVGDWM